jgi:transposase
VLGGIVFMLRADLPWRLLPARGLGAGSLVTCWRRLRDWQAAGVWQQLHAALLDELGRAEGIDWSRICLDSLSVRAKRGVELTGPNPTDRGKPGSKYHLLVDRRGIPLAAGLSAANIHDSMLLEPMVEAVGLVHLAGALICPSPWTGRRLRQVLRSPTAQRVRTGPSRLPGRARASRRPARRRGRRYFGNPTLKTLASRNPDRRSRSTCAFACCTVGN